MRPGEIRTLLRVDEFVPLRIALTDGRSVLARHPDQVFVAERHLLIGLAVLECSKPLMTPNNGDRVVKDWMIVNLLRVTGIEPEKPRNGEARGKRKRRCRCGGAWQRMPQQTTGKFPQ